MRYLRWNRVSRALGAVLLMGSLGACEFIEPITVDPNAVPEATVDQLFTGIQVNTWFFAEGQISRLSSLWTQQMTGTDRQFTALDNYIFNEQDTDGEFQALYTGGGLIDLKQAIAQAEEANRRSYAGILKIHEAFLFGMGASLWGAIPYSQAASSEVERPARDDQAEVYSTVQALLDDAISDLGAGGAGPGSVDMAFGGSTARWTAVAHTLKARFHMHWAESEGSGRYQSAITEAQSGVKDVGGNWYAVHSTAATENNAWYQFLRDRAGYISSGDYLLPLLRDSGDPRLEVYFSPVADGTYKAPSESVCPNCSQMNEAGYGAPDAPFPMATCAENYFILAEAYQKTGSDANAKTAAKNALACQEAAHGVNLTAFKNAIDAASGTALFEEIMEQKYRALFLSPEVWNDYKRACIPDLTPRGSASEIPARFFYGLSERQTNPDNIPEPSAQAGFGGHGYRSGANANDPNACT